MNFDNRTDPYWYYNNSLYNHHKRPIIGGMANYDKNGKLVSQILKNGVIQNYELSKKNFDDNIINNEDYDEVEKKRIIDTEYDELLSLKEAYHNRLDLQDNIDKLIKLLDVQYTEEEKKERDKKTELIIKNSNKFIDEKKETPLFKQAKKEAGEEIEKDFFKEMISYFHNIDFNIVTTATLRDKMGETKYSDFKDFLRRKGMTDDDMNKNIGEILKELKGSNGKYYEGFNDMFLNIVRGEKSEDIHDTHNILLSNYTGDFTEKFNSKDDNFYTPEFVEGFKNELTKFLKTEDKTISNDDINKVHDKIFESVYDNIIPTGDYSIIWNDNNKNGNIFLNASNKTPSLMTTQKYNFNYYNGDIVPPIQNIAYNYDKNNWTNRNYIIKKKNKN
jgi:hypothetical protein